MPAFIFAAVLCILPAHAFAATQIFLTATTSSSWTIPDDWNSANNTIEVIGAGGGAQYIRSGGGGGGAYSEISNLSLTPGNPPITYHVGDGTALASSTSARDTWFSSTGTVLAKGGIKGGSADGVATGVGGAAGSGVGTVKYSGGDATPGSGGSHSTFSGGGGGGAAGIHGDGDDATTFFAEGCGADIGDFGGDGDASYGGSNVSGGDPCFDRTGIGQPGTEWDGSHGSGSGADGNNGDFTDGDGGEIVTGGAYGGGAGGNGCNGDGPVTGCSAEFQAGGMGLIVITYTPAAPTCTLSASRTLIPSGATVALTWTTSNSPTSASIDNGVGSVSTSGGTTNVSPTASTTYTLTVSNGGGSNTCSSTVNLDGDKIVFLTIATTSPWTVPSDWNNASNTIEAIGGGGNAGNVSTLGYGGGAGAYAGISNLTLTSGASIAYGVGAVGPAGSAGGPTYFNGTSGSASVIASGASVTGGAGAASGSTGSVKYDGGAGQTGNLSFGFVTGGGGGAGGPSGAGASGSGTAGGTGDNTHGGTGGASTGTAGGNGVEWDATHGSGGGGGPGAAAGNYGAGGGINYPTFGTGTPGLIVITYTPVTTPGTPGTPTFSNTTATSTTVSWSAASGADTYKVERCTTTGCSSYTQIASGVSGTSYNDTGTLTGNTTYGYRVRATNTSGDGSYSSGAEVTTLPNVPGTPSFSSTTATGTTVSWSAPTGGASTYKVERCTGTGCSSYSQIAGGVSGTSYNDTGTLSPSTTYRYRVRGTNTTGDGLYSAGAEVTTNANAATCTLSASPSGIIPGGSSTLSWTTTDASSASIDNGIGSVSTGSGSTSVTPSATTLYTLTVSGTGGGGSCTATVGVSRSAATFFGGHVLISGSHLYIR